MLLHRHGTNMVTDAAAEPDCACCGLQAAQGKKPEATLLLHYGGHVQAAQEEEAAGDEATPDKPDDTDSPAASDTAEGANTAADAAEEAASDAGKKEEGPAEAAEGAEEAKVAVNAGRRPSTCLPPSPLPCSWSCRSTKPR